MKLYAPLYYKKFKCIADKCSHSCCIGWEIDIDGDTLEKYEKFKDSWGKALYESIDFDETPHFKLDVHDRCPHLTKNGLCQIIINKGEDFICQICKEHPRFYNNTSRGKEVGLGLSCEEACRLILSADFYGETEEIGEINEEEAWWEFDSLYHREKLFSILSDETLTYTEKVSEICKKYKVAPSDSSDMEWVELINSLEYLDDEHRQLFSIYSNNINHFKDHEPYLLRLFSYFIFRHCTDVISEADFIRSLGFCLFCERLFASILCKKKISEFSDVVKIARIISEELEYSEDNTETIKLKF